MSADSVPDRIYHDGEALRRPSEISDPRTTRDETATRAAEWAGENWKVAVPALVIGTLGLFVIAWAMRPFLLSLATNTYVQYAVAALAVFGIGAFVGGKRKAGQLAGQQELMVYYDDSREPEPFQGEFVPVEAGQAFIPYKGRGGLLGGYRPYTMSELMADPAAPNAKARVLVPEKVSGLSLTSDRGVKGVVHTAGFEYYPGGDRHRDPGTARGKDGANMKFALPEDGDPDAMRKAQEKIAEAVEDIEAMDERLSSERRRRGEQQELAQEGFGDLVDHLWELAAIVNVSGRQDRNSLQVLDENTDDGRLEEIRDRVTPEEDDDR